MIRSDSSLPHTPTHVQPPRTVSFSSSPEAVEVMMMFNAFSHGANAIQIESVPSLLRALGNAEIDSGTIERLMLNLDPQGTGRVTREAFVRSAMYLAPKRRTMEELLAAFGSMDHYQKGYITLEDMLATSVGVLNPQQCRLVLEGVASDPKRGITLDEFRRAATRAGEMNEITLRKRAGSMNYSLAEAPAVPLPN